MLSHSFVFRHFLTCAEEQEWKAGKRRAEKDEFCGAQLLLTIEHPDVRTDLNKAYVMVVNTHTHTRTHARTHARTHTHTHTHTHNIINVTEVKRLNTLASSSQ